MAATFLSIQIARTVNASWIQTSSSSAHDWSAGSKHDRAAALVRELCESGQGVLSTQVLQELCVNLQRRTKRPRPPDEIKRLVQDYRSWRIVINTPQTIIEALDVQQRQQISFRDALILCAAEGASILYCEDLTADQKYGSIRVVNPFKPEPLPESKS